MTTTPIERFVWDLTYACPLRCIHCYSESGRREPRTVSRATMQRIVQVIIAAKPKRISFGGGEPLLAPWWSEAARLLCDGGVPVTLFTGGSLMDGAMARELAESVSSVCVSVDGAIEQTHDAIRGRRGSFRNAMQTLELLDGCKRERAAHGASCYTFGIDYTVTRSNVRETERFVEEVTSRFAALDFIRFGAVIPEGLAQEERFVERELLTLAEVAALQESEPRLASLARNDTDVSVTDARGFLIGSDMSFAGETIAHIEPDGQLRAFTTYEAKVGNVLEEPLDVLWERALAWRRDPFVVEQLRSIRSHTDWARVARCLDRRYGSAADQARIRARGAIVEPPPLPPLPSHAPSRNDLSPCRGSSS